MFVGSALLVFGIAVLADFAMWKAAIYLTGLLIVVILFL